MIVEFISVGTEILLGNIVNTNTQYLAEKCAGLGLSNYFQVSVGDNEERLAAAITQALSRADIVMLTGGLGPTEDDLTKEVTAKVLSLELKEDAHTKERIMDYFSRRGINRPPTMNNWKQAMIPEGAKVIDNHNGTAPGIIIWTRDNKHIVLMPGPPNELEPMFENDIAPYLNNLEPEVIYSETIKITGLGESFVENEIKDLIEAQSNPTIAPYAKTGEVHLRITAKTDSKEKAEKLILPIKKELIKRFGLNVYTTDESVTLEACVTDLLMKNQLTLATAESCTGGLFAARIVNVAGASNIFSEGVITYSNKVKQELLGVSPETLQKYGAVSEQTAIEMAEGARRLSGADVAVSITGIAGPGGGSDKKPVGLVYVGCSLEDKTKVCEYRLRGNRQKIREYSVVYALDFLRNCILKNLM